MRWFTPRLRQAAGFVARAVVAATVSGVGGFGASLPAQAQALAPGKWYGFNLAGAEWDENNLPGVRGKDYVYSNDPKRYRYFESKGFTLVRIPFRWERVQPESGGALSAPDVAGLRTMLNQARSHGQKGILVVQNFGRYYRQPLNPGDGAGFADLWSRLSGEFKDHEGLFGYELMNEPHDLPGGSATWAKLAQAATDGIRTQDQTHWVLVPGYHWQTAATWRTHNEGLNVKDSAGRLLYAAHQYFDADHSGRYDRSYAADGATPNIGVNRLKPFTDWLEAKGFLGIVTEYGVPEDAPWLVVLDEFMKAVHRNPRLAGGTAWASGPLWEPSFPGGYPLLLDPVWSPSGTAAEEKPQVAVLARVTVGVPPPVPTSSPVPPPPAAVPTSSPVPAPPAAVPTSSPVAAPPAATPPSATATVTPTPPVADGAPAVTPTPPSGQAPAEPAPATPAPAGVSAPATTPTATPATSPAAVPGPAVPAPTSTPATLATSTPVSNARQVVLSAPPDLALNADFAPALSWVNPPATTQVHLQVVPFNNDGPGVNLIRDATSAFQLARPELGVGNYVLLPDVTYMWRVRTTTATTALGEHDEGWGAWAERRFRTPRTADGTLTPVSPPNGGVSVDRTPKLQWHDRDSRIFYYEVQVSTDRTFETDPARATAAVYSNLVHGGVSAPLNSYTVPDSAALQPRATYYWRVRPRIQGDGTPVAWSASYVFTTP